MLLRIGTAGWSIPRAAAPHFAAEGTHLQRYARIFTAVEINSSFHRPHAQTTYQRWARSTPPSFRFAVKLPRAITHEGALRDARTLLERFLEESGGLGERRGPLLIQLPPKLAFAPAVARGFFDLLRSLHAGPVVCEPRHATWFTAAAEKVMIDSEVTRVAADPPPVPGADGPGGWPGLLYFRLHGSPRRYWSKYDEPYVAGVAEALRSAPPTVERWCIFDNTASGAAIENAFDLRRSVDERVRDR